MNETNIYDWLEDNGFFAYSGDDGDLYRKRGLKGIRISVYPWVMRIQRREGGRWLTLFRTNDSDDLINEIIRLVK